MKWTQQSASAAVWARLYGLAFILALSSACRAREPKLPPPDSTMTTTKSSIETQNGLLLKLAPGGQGDVLLPEQGAIFDLVLKNQTAAPVEAVDLNRNNSTPEFSLFAKGGQLLVKVDPSTRIKRVRGHVRVTPGPPSSVSLLPGEELKDSINLWKYMDPLAPGNYQLSAAHGEPKSLVSEAVPFQIVAADVAQVSHGYQSLGGSAVFAWLATSRGVPGDTKLLVRLSGAHHEQVAVGALSYGPASPRARIAVSGLPTAPRDETDGWVAVVSGSSVELIHEDLAVPGWRSGPIQFPAAEIRPLSRFPNRGHAVFLATGASASGKPLLLGIRVEAGEVTTEPANAPQPHPSTAAGVDAKSNEPAPKLPTPPPAKAATLPNPWSIPLEQQTLMAECVFGREGPIRLLLVSGSGDELVFSRLDVSETGAVESRERVVGRSSLKLLATAVDKTKPQQPEFLVLLADRKRSDLMALARVPIEGDMNVPAPEAVRGWPTLKTQVPDGAKEVPREVGEIFLEVASDGEPWIAFTDNRGGFNSGPLRGHGVELLREGGSGKHCLAPRVVVSLDSTEPCCFTETGNLFHVGGHGGH